MVLFLLLSEAKYKADLADILIARSAETLGCVGGITFDKQAAKLPFFNLLNR